MLDLTELREHIGPGPEDDVLQRLLDAAIESINERHGPTGEVSELLTPSGSLAHLSYRAQSVSEVTEGTEVLDYTEYTLRPSGKHLVRMHDGFPIYWRARIDVTYLPFPDEAERNRIAIALVNLDLGYQPGLTGITIGPWSEQYMQGDKSYGQEREAILRSLHTPTVGVW